MLYGVFVVEMFNRRKNKGKSVLPFHIHYKIVRVFRNKPHVFSVQGMKEAIGNNFLSNPFTVRNTFLLPIISFFATWHGITDWLLWVD